MAGLSRVARVRARLRVEGPRVWAALLPALLCGALISVVWPAERPSVLGDAENVVMATVVYQVSYLVITAVAWYGADHDDLVAAAERMPRRGSMFARWNRFGEPGAGSALGVASLAMVVAILVLPRAEDAASRMVPSALTALCVVLVLTAWAAVVLTYAVDYLRLDHHEGGLQFPDTDPRVFSDYLYFSLNVATTFGTTDVSVVRADLRRVVIGQSLVAFLFSAIIITLSVTALSA